MVGCLLAGIAGYYVLNLSASWQLHRELAGVVKRGEPLRLARLAPPTPPEGRNAATVYLQAANALVLTSEEENALRSKKGTQTDPALLEKNLQAIQLTRRAAAIPGCRFPIDYDASNLAAILLPHIGKMRRLAEVLRAQAIWEAHNGQREAALDDIAVLFRMSEHLAPEPILISGLSAIGLELTAYSALARVLDECALTPEQAHAFAQRLGHADWTEVLRSNLRGERCFGLWAFQYISNPAQAGRLLESTTAPTNHPGMKIFSVLWAPLWKLDEIQYLRAIDRRSAALGTPGVSLASDDAFLQALPWYAICTKVMLPVLPATGQRRDQALNYRAMAEIALALNAYKTSEGHYPPDLRTAEAAWGASFPRDVYTGQPFVYRYEGEKIRLYSVGPNHHDDNGKQQTHGDASSSPADDLPW